MRSDGGSRLGAEIENYDPGARDEAEKQNRRVNPRPCFVRIAEKKILCDDDDQRQRGGDFLAAEREQPGGECREPVEIPSDRLRAQSAQQIE